MAKASKKSFTATIQEHDGGGAFVTIPFDVEATFGSKRPKITATIDGEPYRGTLVRMGGPDHILIVLKSIRATIGKQRGDAVRVEVALDSAERVITPPADFASALKAASAARAFWRTLSYSHQREYVQWIEEAKRAETRERRIVKAVAMLGEGVKERR